MLHVFSINQVKLVACSPMISAIKDLIWLPSFFLDNMRSCFNSCTHQCAGWTQTGRGTRLTFCTFICIYKRHPFWHSLTARCELTVVLVGSVGCLIVSVSDTHICLTSCLFWFHSGKMGTGSRWNMQVNWHGSSNTWADADSFQDSRVSAS